MAAPHSDSTGLSPVSRDWLGLADPAVRKRGGQYLTPRPVADALLDRLQLEPGMRVLDPGVGTGELLRAVLDREPGVEAHGWDVDPGVLAAAARLVPEARLEQRSALDAGSRSGPGSVQDPGSDPAAVSGDFDLVIANPPYFQIRLDPADRTRFRSVISGRPNIFALFFQVGLERLGPGGVLAFIVPPSMNSGAYFEALREHIVARARILDLTVLPGSDRFAGANTAVQLLVLERAVADRSDPEAGADREAGTEGAPSGRFIFRREVPANRFRRVIFTPNPGKMAAEFEGRRTIWDLGCEAVTGSVVWNRERERLRPKPGPGTVPLVWSRNLRSGELQLDGAGGGSGKPQFIDPGPIPVLRGPALLVNRVVGAVGRGELRTARVPAGVEFLAENHVNVIRPRTGDAGPVGIDWPGLQRALDRPGVAARIRLLTGNTQLSARELTHMIPLDP